MHLLEWHVVCELKANTTHKAFVGRNTDIRTMKTKFTRLALLLSIGSLMPVAFAQVKEKT